MTRFWMILFAIVVILVTAVLMLGLWNGSGNLADVIAGQSPAAPQQLNPAASSAPGTDAPYTAQASVDLSNAVYHLPAEYLSFSIDASQLVGGKWWDPKASQVESGSGTVRAPRFDFNRPKLDLLTHALAPAYLRIGGSESDKIYYDLASNGPASAPPAGYQSVLTRAEWDAANAFAGRNQLKLVFTLNAGPGSRQAGKAWDGSNSAALLKYSAGQGYPVDSWELGNEMNLFWFVHGLDQQVSTAQYSQDLGRARELVQKYTPGAHLGGEGSAFWPVIGEPLSLFFGFMPGYLSQSAALVDQVSWHYYPQQSRRGPVATRRASPARMLNPDALDEAAYWAEQMRAWRDQYAPGKPIWLGETGNAQFGGEPGLSDAYLGGLWWLDELGLVARSGTQVVVRQTLSGSNYGMIDDSSLEPRPDYWNSLLWKRLMGADVYSALAEGDNSENLRVYAQSTPGRAGAVTLLVINIDPARSARVQFPGFGNHPAQVYTLSSPDLFGQELRLNGQLLALEDESRLPDLQGKAIPAAAVPYLTLNPLSYAFIVFPGP